MISEKCRVLESLDPIIRLRNSDKGVRFSKECVDSQKIDDEGPRQVEECRVLEPWNRTITFWNRTFCVRSRGITAFACETKESNGV